MTIENLLVFCNSIELSLHESWVVRLLFFSSSAISDFDFGPVGGGFSAYIGKK